MAIPENIWKDLEIGDIIHTRSDKSRDILVTSIDRSTGKFSYERLYYKSYQISWNIQYTDCIFHSITKANPFNQIKSFHLGGYHESQD